MARKRMIDPEFFLDEELAKLKPHTRLLYIGSWQIADDRSYVIPYRSDWVKAQIFPYESLDIDEFINELIDCTKFIVFENEGKKYIFIPNMAIHQKIEHPSKQKYPFHPNHKEIVDRVKKRALGEPSVSPLPDSQGTLPSSSNKYIYYIDIFNKKMNTNIYMTDSRREHLKARMKEKLFVDHFEEVLDKIKSSPFLSGKRPSKDHPNWKADFDWIIKNQDNYTKVLEDKYHSDRDAFREKLGI